MAAFAWYLFRDAMMPLFLITVFAKNDMPNLTKAQRNAMGVLVDGIVTDWQTRLVTIEAAAKDRRS